MNRYVTPRQQCTHRAASVYIYTRAHSLCVPLSLSLSRTRTYIQVLPFILRRTKVAVASELPTKTVIDVPCPLSAVQRRMYADFQRGTYLLTDIYCVLLRTFHLLYISYSDLSYRLTGLPSLLPHSALSFHLSLHLNPNHLVTVP